MFVRVWYDSRVDWVVITIFILVEDVSMSVGEGTSFNILTRNSYIEAILNKSCKSKSFSCSPINTFTCGDSLLSLFENLSYKSVELFILWKFSNLDSNFLESFKINSGNFRCILIKVMDLVPFI